MSGIVSRAFLIFTDAKDKKFTCNFFVILWSKIHRKRQNLQLFFQLKWLIYVEKLSPFSLFARYASDNLVQTLLQLGTFHAHFLLTLYKVYKETAVHVTAGQC